MTCRCSSKEEHASRAVEQANQSARWDADQLKAKAAATEREANARIAELQARTPNPDQYAVDEIEQVGAHLVVRVEYPGCVKCSFDRRKVMVFLDVALKDVIKWRRIDPHFREPGHRSTLPAGAREAPSPAARFPASADGWRDAIEYASRKGCP